jgi:hypothetical protein
MSFRQAIRHPANVAALFLFGLIVAVYAGGYTLQDHRPPEDQAYEIAEQYISDHHNYDGSARITECVRGVEEADDIQAGVYFYVSCHVAVDEGNRLFSVSVAFGRRNQVEFSDVAELR